MVLSAVATPALPQPAPRPPGPHPAAHSCRRQFSPLVCPRRTRNLADLFDGKKWRSRPCEHPENGRRRRSTPPPQSYPATRHQIDIEYVAGTNTEMIEDFLAQGDLSFGGHCSRDGHYSDSIEFDSQNIRQSFLSIERMAMLKGGSDAEAELLRFHGNFQYRGEKAAIIDGRTTPS